MLAAEHDPSADPSAGCRKLDAIGKRALAFLSGEDDPGARVEGLIAFRRHEEGFRGNEDDYAAPLNSHLPAVLERRTGIPITLALVYMEVGARAGVPIHGIGFPGHFLAKIVKIPESAMGEIIVDPFFGRTLSLDDCADRLRAAAGEEVHLDPEWLRPATSNEIYVRMLNNLKMHFLRRGDGLAALGCFDRILVLAPQAASEYRDRGLLLERLDCVLPAIEDLTQYLELAPGEEDAPAIRARRNALGQRKPALN